jgi:hypothetical protein
LPGAEHVVVRFRQPQSARIVGLAAAALDLRRERAARYREAQGLRDGVPRRKRAADD